MMAVCSHDLENARDFSQFLIDILEAFLVDDRSIVFAIIFKKIERLFIHFMKILDHSYSRIEDNMR